MMQFSRKQKQQIRKIAQKYDLELILLFGSRVEGKIHKESDFDVAYSSSRDLGLMEEAQLIVAENISRNEDWKKIFNLSR